MSSDRKEYPWFARCYYNKDVKPPKRPNTMAIETKHKTKMSLDIEVVAMKSRSDIGRVEWGTR